MTPPDHAALGSVLEGAADLWDTTSTIGILVADPRNHRLIEGASGQLGLKPVTLSASFEELPNLATLELIIADESVARSIRLRREQQHDGGVSEGLSPALIAVRGAASPISDAEPEFDGVLVLPQEPGLVTAQLSIFLYAHRAFARRYQSAIEELQLNRRIFRSVTSGISVANATLPDMPLVYVNPAFEVMTGFHFEDVQGRNCRFLQREDHDQPGLTLIREAIQSQREVVAVIRNYRKDGTPFWNELSLSPIRNRDGQLTHFVGIQFDVTARVEFEAALRESEKLAAVGRLAASIAHEINNPLESITNLLYLAQRTDDLNEVRDYLTIADKELQRVSLITSQSLRFYRQSTAPRAIRCTDLLAPVLDLYGAKIANAEVEVSLRERMSESIVCLESEIRQVLSNLIRNAIDAMHGKGGRLLIRSREATEWRSGTLGAMITIADTGHGIPPEILSKLYTAFFTTKGIGGTGLGLWVSSEIVKRHHGRIRVRSCNHPDHGWTVFELYLPFQGLAS